MPGARIFTFGYNADVCFGNTTAEIVDHAGDLLSSLIDEREDDQVSAKHIPWSGVVQLGLPCIITNTLIVSGRVSVQLAPSRGVPDVGKPTSVQ